MPGVADCIDGLGPDATCQEDLDIDGDGLLSFCACPDVDNDGLILTQNIEIAGARKIADCAGSSRVMYQFLDLMVNVILRDI